MGIVRANPTEYLVVGRSGKLNNLGTAVQTFLWPGSLFVLIPSTKQATGFELSQESKDAIPLRLKGIVVYRITDPVAAAKQFDFNSRRGLDDINLLLRQISMGELRAVVSQMTMLDCIEQRKTTLTSAVEAALRQVVQGGEGANVHWGIELEVVQVAQVFIEEAELRKQLEAEVRNEIKARSDQSDIRTQEDIRSTQIESERRLQEKKLEAEKDNLRRKEEIELAQITYKRRLQQEQQETVKAEILLDRDKYRLEQEATEDKANASYPIRLLEIQNRRALLNEELDMRRLENQLKELEVQRDLLLDKERMSLRKEILPLEQVPAIAEAAAKVFHGANLSIYAQENTLLPLVAPLLDLFARVLNATGGNGKH